MTRPGTDASSSERIAELEAEKARFGEEKAARFAEEQAFRRRENPTERISFAKEIFESQHEQRRLEVEILFIEQKIRRLRLGYAEDVDPAADVDRGTVF